MKLPRWLSPVRTVEAETGWPPELCRRFAGAAAKCPRRLGIILTAYAFVIAPLIGGAGAYLAATLPSGAPAARAFFIVGVLVLMGGPPFIAAAGAVEFTRRTRRVLRHYLTQPLCLRCTYPVPAPSLDGPPVCPECGEPIPPEIAKLVAERKAGSA